MTDPAASSGPLDPAEFARLVAEADDEQLAAGMAANRDFILTEVFRRMPERFDPAAAGDLSAVSSGASSTAPTEAPTASTS